MPFRGCDSQRELLDDQAERVVARNVGQVEVVPVGHRTPFACSRQLLGLDADRHDGLGDGRGPARGKTVGEGPTEAIGAPRIQKESLARAKGIQESQAGSGPELEEARSSHDASDRREEEEETRQDETRQPLC